jgi:hypothetical protein
MPLVLIWFAFAIGVGFSAAGNGRNFWIWFLLACVISPLFAWLLLTIISGS